MHLFPLTALTIIRGPPTKLLLVLIFHSLMSLHLRLRTPHSIWTQACSDLKTEKRAPINCRWIVYLSQFRTSPERVLFKQSTAIIVVESSVKTGLTNSCLRAVVSNLLHNIRAVSQATDSTRVRQLSSLVAHISQRSLLQHASMHGIRRRWCNERHGLTAVLACGSWISCVDKRDENFSLATRQTESTSSGCRVWSVITVWWSEGHHF